MATNVRYRIVEGNMTELLGQRNLPGTVSWGIDMTNRILTVGFKEKDETRDPIQQTYLIDPKLFVKRIADATRGKVKLELLPLETDA